MIRALECKCCRCGFGDLSLWNKVAVSRCCTSCTDIRQWCSSSTVTQHTTNSFDHSDNKGRQMFMSVFMCTCVGLSPCSLWIWILEGFCVSSILKPQTHQTNIIQLVAMKADCCVASFSNNSCTRTQRKLFSRRSTSAFVLRLRERLRWWRSCVFWQHSC